VPDDEIVIPALLRAARGSYGRVIRARLAACGCEDMPRNGAFVLGGMANRGASAGAMLGGLGVTRSAGCQLLDVLVARGYLERVTAQELAGLRAGLGAPGGAGGRPGRAGLTGQAGPRPPLIRAINEVRGRVTWRPTRRRSSCRGWAGRRRRRKAGRSKSDSVGRAGCVDVISALIPVPPTRDFPRHAILTPIAAIRPQSP
jgi:hypothetical protein